MKTVALIQARLASTRLPAKVLAPIAGVPMISHIYRRVSSVVPAWVVAVKAEEPHWPRLDVPLLFLDVPVDDVLGRYRAAVRILRPDVVVRITGDCPLVDPATIRMVLDELDGYEIAQNVPAVPNGWPDGLEVQAFAVRALDRLSDTQHVIPARLPGPWRLVTQPRLDWHPLARAYKLSVDTLDDLNRVRRIYDALGPDCTYPQVMEWLQSQNLA